MKSKAFNITMPEELIKKIDQQAKKQFTTRSAFIRSSINSTVAQLEKWDKIFAYSDRIGREIGYKTEEEVAQIVNDSRRGK